MTMQLRMRAFSHPQRLTCQAQVRHRPCMQSSCLAPRRPLSGFSRRTAILIAKARTESNDAPDEEEAEYEVVEVEAVEPGEAELEPERGYYEAASPSYPSTSEPESDSIWPQLGMVVGAIVGLGALLFFARKKLFSGSKLEESIQGGLDHRKLQREATDRLNEFAETFKGAKANLAGKNLGEEGAAYLAENLAFNDRCTTADLSSNGIGQKGVAALCEAMATNTVLESLILDTNNLGDEGAEALATILASNTGLRSLNLGSNNIGDQGAIVLAEALKLALLQLNTTLTSLDLSGNAVDRSGTEAIADALRGNSALEVLHISNNYLGEEGAALLGAALEENETLTELHLKGNALGDAGVASICQALAKRQCPIKSLDLGNNELTASGADSLVALLKKARISELSLQMNDLKDDGIIKVAGALEGSDSLESLDVSGNAVGSYGILALAKALKDNQNLRTLEVSYNPIEATGAKALIDMLKFDLQVENLKMGWCKLGKVEGAAAVADLIMFNTTLNTLDVRGNSFEDNGAILISRALKEHGNDHLQELDLAYNEIKDDGACQLALALKNNPNNAPLSFKVNANHLTNFGQTALLEALDTVYELSGNREMKISF